MPFLETRPIDYTNMVDGVNTIDSSLRLGPSKFRDAQNVNLFPVGGFSWRNGYAKVNSTALNSGAVPTGLYSCRFSTGTIQPFVVCGNKIYSFNISTGASTDITNGTTITAGQNNLWKFDILNDLVVACNDTDTCLQITNANVVTTLGGSPAFTSALFAVQYHGYMFYGQTVETGTRQYDRLRFSDINAPNSFTSLGTNNFIDVAVKSGGDVRGAVEYNTNLYVFKRHGIYEINFNPTRVNSAGTLFPFLQYPNPIVPGVGTQSHRSICKFTTPITHSEPGQEIIFFVDQFGVPRIFDGRATIQVGRPIVSSRDTTITSLAALDMTQLPYVWAINYPDRNQVWVFMSKSNQKMDTCWVLDYTLNFAWTRHSFATQFNAGALIEKSNGTFRPYTVDYSGFVYAQDSGTNDAGTAITSYVTCGDAYNGTPSMKSNWPWIEIRGTTGGTSQNVTIDFYPDGSDSSTKTLTTALATTQTTWGTSGPGGTMTWGSSLWAKAGVVTKQPVVNVDAKSLRVKLSNSTKDNTASIESFSLYSRPQGSSAV